MNYDDLAAQFGGQAVDGDRIANFQLEAEAAQKDASKSIGRRFAEELPGQLARTVFGAPAKFVKSAALAPVDIGRGLAGKAPLNAGTYQSEAGERAGRIVEGQQPLYHALAPFGEVPLAALETVGLAKGGSRLFKSGQQALAGRAEQKALSRAVDITKPKLTPIEEEMAKRSGRARITGLSRRVEIAPTERDITVADAVKDVVKGKDPFKDIDAIQVKIGKTSEKVLGGFDEVNPIFNTKQLRANLGVAKEDSRVIFGTDKALERAYDDVVDEFVRIVDKGKKDAKNLYKARISFDQLMKRKFGPDILNPAKAGDKVRSNALLDVRRAANDYVAELLPEGNQYKNLLKQENMMFEAIKNIAKNSPPAGSTAISRFGRKNPQLKGAIIGGGLSTGVGIGIGTLLNRD